MEDSRLNKMNAASGHHDDIVMATAIALYVSDSFQAKQTRQVIKEKSNGGFLDNMIKYKRKTKVRKGIYTNNA
jgi:hypothetical protein